MPMPKWVEESMHRAEKEGIRQADKQQFKRRLKSLKKSNTFKLSVSAHLDHDVKRGHYVILQQQLEESAAGKADAILLHASKIPALVDCLTLVKRSFRQYDKNLQEQTVLKTPIDDIVMTTPEEKPTTDDIHSQVTVDNLDLTEWQSSYRQKMAELFARRMLPHLHETVQKKCAGCINQCGTQNHHDLCVVADYETRVDVCFDDLIDRVNEEEVNAALFSVIKETAPLSVNTKQAYFTKQELLCDPTWIQSVKQYMMTITSHN